MIEIKGLTRRYGSRAAVDDVSLDIEAGRFIGVIGRSGAGKSTLLRMINRLETPTAGVIRFGDVEVTRLRGAGLADWRARCAMIFQQFNLVGRLDVLTNVLMGRLAQIPSWRSLTQSWPEQDKALAMSNCSSADIAIALSSSGHMLRSACHAGTCAIRPIRTFVSTSRRPIRLNC